MPPINMSNIAELAWKHRKYIPTNNNVVD
ncbi:uncharacterized protein G2W53_033148 [Senna tora]|uniref:Uncharacterized protein n=1 Tax=Senna tora TaxID=362788 RepID=A0A834SZJ7_9FABA|nr:uncharacterized protein G2W53_033148 [Senna tora]